MLQQTMACNLAIESRLNGWRHEQSSTNNTETVASSRERCKRCESETIARTNDVLSFTIYFLYLAAELHLNFSSRFPIVCSLLGLITLHCSNAIWSVCAGALLHVHGCLAWRPRGMDRKMLNDEKLCTARNAIFLCVAIMQRRL